MEMIHMIQLHTRNNNNNLITTILLQNILVKNLTAFTKAYKIQNYPNKSKLNLSKKKEVKNTIKKTKETLPIKHHSKILKKMRQKTYFNKLSKARNKQQIKHILTCNYNLTTSNNTYNLKEHRKEN